MVLFTSGTEGVPKGVVLSHANILANIAQIDARFDLRLTDVFFNPLPIFHAFGLTGGLLLGLMTSMKVYLYPTPLHYRQIPELIDKVGATVLIGADTFLAAYARNADAYGFRTLRYVIAGGRAAEGRDAPGLHGEVRPAPARGLRRDRGLAGARGQHADVQQERNGRQAPAVHRGAASSPCPASTRAGGSIVRGPNVMIGYYRADNPGELEPPPGGWHDTGDIVAIDADGFVAIKGRAKRFAKIAGELVSLGAVEDLLSGLWPDDVVAAVAAPDPKRGERVILATTHAGATKVEVADLDEDQGRLRHHGSRPRSSCSTRSRCLGSGKTDYIALARVLRERAA